MSWGKKPEQKRREKEYNRQYYLKHKTKRSAGFPMISDTGGYTQSPHDHVVTGQVPLSWAHQHAMETISQMTFKDKIKDIIKSTVYSLEDKYPQYSKVINAGFEFVQKLLKD